MCAENFKNIKNNTIHIQKLFKNRYFISKCNNSSKMNFSSVLEKCMSIFT